MSSAGTYRALRIDPDGSKRVVNVPHRDALPLLQHHVGGLIQLVPISSSAFLYCNDEGKILGLPPNETASRLASGSLQRNDFVVGPVLVIAAGQDGDERDLVDDDLERLGLDDVEWCYRCFGRGWVPIPADCVSDGDADACPDCTGTGLCSPSTTGALS